MTGPFETADIDAALAFGAAVAASPSSCPLRAAVVASIAAWLDGEEAATRMDIRQCMAADVYFESGLES